MKKFIYIIVVLFSFGCANNASKKFEVEVSDAFEPLEEQSNFSENDAYTLLITQKIQEHIDRKTLANANPEFGIEEHPNNVLLAIEEGGSIKEINLIFPFETVSDSVKKVKTRIVLDHKIDTILTLIKNSKVEIDGEQFTTTKITFKSVKK